MKHAFGKTSLSEAAGAQALFGVGRFRRQAGFKLLVPAPSGRSVFFSGAAANRMNEIGSCYLHGTLVIAEASPLNSRKESRPEIGQECGQTMTCRPNLLTRGMVARRVRSPRHIKEAS